MMKRIVMKKNTKPKTLIKIKIITKELNAEKEKKDNIKKCDKGKDGEEETEEEDDEEEEEIDEEMGKVDAIIEKLL